MTASVPPIPRYLLVTGTDTGVGKTFVGRALARVLVAKGIDVVAVKPVESGCGELAAAEQDGALLAAETGQAAPRSALVRLAAPLTPPVAAEQEGIRLDLEAWIRILESLGEAVDLVLVEGAGGLLSPLTRVHTTRDLALRLDAETLVVAADRLGTLNHTLLTLDALRAVGIAPRAVALSAPEVADASTGRNAAEIARWGSVPVVEIPRGSLDEAAARLRPVADWLVG